jgi:ribosomal protein L37AE/L43A
MYLVVGVGNMIVDFLQPKSEFSQAIKSISEAVTPLADTVGECTFCKSLHYQCPRCGSAVMFPSNKRVGVDMIKCKKCGKKMRTG